MLNNPMTLRFLLAFSLLGLLLMACKKDTVSATPDPRDPYVGTWIEQSTNGVPARTGLTDTLLISKTAGSNAKLTVGRLIRSGDFTVSPVTTGVGYQADNTPVKTGTIFNFQNGSSAEVTLDALTMTVSGAQMTMTYRFSAKSSTQTAAQDFVEILTKR